jgi:hypothetical protein
MDFKWEQKIVEDLPEQHTKKIKLRGWFSFFVLLFSGEIIFGAPAIIFAIKDPTLYVNILQETIPEKLCAFPTTLIGM